MQDPFSPPNLVTKERFEQFGAHIMARLDDGLEEIIKQIARHTPQNSSPSNINGLVVGLPNNFVPVKRDIDKQPSPIDPLVDNNKHAEPKGDEESDSSYHPLARRCPNEATRRTGINSKQSRWDLSDSEEDSLLACHFIKAPISKFNMPSLERFDGSGNLDDHLQHFKMNMRLNGITESLLCMAFPTTLRNFSRH